MKEGNNAPTGKPGPKDSDQGQLYNAEGADSEPKLDTKVAFDFLKAFHPKGAWTIVALPALKSHKPDGWTFKTGDKDVHTWLEKHAKYNIYFSTNQVYHLVHKKPEREDIKEVRYHHVDLDPRAGEELNSEQQRILKKLTDPPGGGQKSKALPLAAERSSSRTVTARS